MKNEVEITTTLNDQLTDEGFLMYRRMAKKHGQHLIKAGDCG